MPVLFMPCMFMACRRRETRIVALLLIWFVVVANGGSLGEPPPTGGVEHLKHCYDLVRGQVLFGRLPPFLQGRHGTPRHCPDELTQRPLVVGSVHAM